MLTLSQDKLIHTVQTLANAIDHRIKLSTFYYTRNDRTKKFFITHIKQIKSYIIYLLRYVNICNLKGLDLKDILKDQKIVFDIIQDMIDEQNIHLILRSNGVFLGNINYYKKLIPFIENIISGISFNSNILICLFKEKAYYYNQNQLYLFKNNYNDVIYQTIWLNILSYNITNCEKMNIEYNTDIDIIEDLSGILDYPMTKDEKNTVRPKFGTIKYNDYNPHELNVNFKY